VLSSEPQTSCAVSPEPKDPILKVFTAEPHQVYTAEELVKILKLQPAKDPQKQAEAVAAMTAKLRQLAEAGRITEVADGTFKARLFFDKEEHVEHAYIGGRGNTRYRFRSPIFRLNIGVLSLFCVKDNKAGDWKVTVRDTTIGKDYGLVQPLRDGTYTFGSQSPEAGQDHYRQIEGKYIAKKHVTITISGEEVAVEDHETQHGTRINFLTLEGLARYQESAKAFLQATDPKDHRDPVKRGRFVLERLLHDHQDFDTSFFSAAVDSLLL